jgi:predicted ester cyclase
MTAEDNRRTMDAYLSALTSFGDFGAFFSEDALWITMETGEQVRGREAVRDLILLFHQQVFDARAEIKGVIVDENSAVLEADFVGTQQLEFAGIAPSGGSIRVPYTMVYELSEGKITQLRAYLPFTTIRDQLMTAVPAHTE